MVIEKAYNFKSEKLEEELNKTCSFENAQYCNTRNKILPTPFQWYSSYGLLNVLVTEERFSVCAIYSVTYTNPHSNTLCIYNLQVIGIANEE